MKIVLGLGNPGARYEATRHNVGFRVVDLIARRHGALFEARGELGERASIARVRLGIHDVVLAKPRTFMNRSGSAAIALARKFMAAAEDLVVVFDDADLEMGRVRVRPEGGAGGHNGVRSILEVLGSPKFVRVKLGVRGEGREASDLADYVLRPFAPDEGPALDAMVALAADAVESVVIEGTEAAMQRFNGPPPGRGGPLV